MRIGMVLDRTFPPDIRVEKEARTLLKAGHEVYLLCMKAPDLPADDVFEGIQLRRRPFHQAQWPLFRRLETIVDRPKFKNHTLIDQVGNFINEDSIDVLHAHDLPVVKSVLIAAQRKGIPVVADLHENYPAAKQTYLDGENFRYKLLNGLEKWKRYENECLNQVDPIIVVVDEARERVINDYGIPEERISMFRFSQIWTTHNG